MEICLICSEIKTFCQCEKTITDKDEFIKWLKDKLKSTRILYKQPDDIKYSVHIEQKEGMVIMQFSCDGGKFGTEEQLDEIKVSPKYLLQILQKHIEKP